jgi:1-acyl-sn-glycerol-3-phosphate acyltransferase
MTGPENGVVADEPDGVEEAIRKPKKRSRIVRWKAYISFMLIKLAGRTLKHMLGMNVTVVNRQAVPKTGKHMLWGNHISMGDPAFWGATTPRNGSIMFAKELSRIRGLRFLLKWGDHISVDRDIKEGRANAFEKADNLMAQGVMVGMFNEAGIKRYKWRWGPAELLIKHQGTLNVVRVIGIDRFWPTKSDRKKYGWKRFDFKAPIEVIYSDVITPEMYADMTPRELTLYAHDLCYSLEVPKAA